MILSNNFFNFKGALFRKSCLLILLLLALFGVGQAWYFAKAGFNINRILFPLTVELSSLLNQSEEEIRPLLEQSYHYLGKGRQCYAFESSDGLTVLKIPRLDRYTLSLPWKMPPLSFFQQKKNAIWRDKQERFVFLFESFRIAALELASQTGMRYLHLHRTENLPKKLILYDQLHRRFCIDPNRIAFALQIKTPLMMPALLTALRKKDRKTAEEILDAFFLLIEERSKLGIFNKDPSFLKNFGWQGGKGIQIDIGSFYRKSGLNSEEAYRLSLEDSTERLRGWLREIDPALRIRFDQRLEECLRKSLLSAS